MIFGGDYDFIEAGAGAVMFGATEFDDMVESLGDADTIAASRFQPSVGRAPLLN